MVHASEAMAEQILDALGGSANIHELTHCATRLHVTLDDENKVSLKQIEAIPGVLGAFPRAGGRYQIIIGGAVASVYERMMSAMKSVASRASEIPRTSQETEHFAGPATAAASDATSQEPSQSSIFHMPLPRTIRAWASAILDYVSDSFRPLLGVLLGASIIIALANVAVALGLTPDGNATDGWRALKAIWEVMFVMLPIMIATNAARKLNVDSWLGGAIMSALMAPQIAGLSGGISAFGMVIPINDYSGSVFVPLLMVALLGLVYHGLKRVIANSVQLVFVPFCSLVVVYVFSVLFVGPLGVWLGSELGAGTAWLNAHVPFLFALLIPMLYPFLVPLGLHWPLNALMLMNIQTLGYDFVQGPMGVWNFACFGVTAGVLVLAIRERDPAMRQTSLSALLAGLLGGVSELSLYGIHLQHRRTYRWLLAGCAAGGLSSALLSWLFPSVLPSGQVIHGVTTTAFAFSSLLTIPVFNRAWVYALSIAIAFAVAMLLTVLFDYRMPQSVAAQPKAADSSYPLWHADSPNALFAPIAGSVVDLDSIGDPVFASKALGEGVGIMPDDSAGAEAVYAPVSGTVKTVAKTGHAFGIKTDDGVEVLVHIGLDTVDMGGEGFVLQVGKGDCVAAGDVLLQVDFAAIVRAGHNPVVVMTVVNTMAMTSVMPLLVTAEAQQGESRKVTAGEPIIDVER
ncbi:PTS system EIIC component [Bifidobacterium saguini DSM 23967]|uniref:PTS system EIIC component n=2 Tax=Bifidobacterium saguini TaxID=762210 RepID=A0A087DE98_9BIFI|nr:glucose PTS transporter subunit IIA [Bifidobacterium saguini]KFI93848.1 PTS system EIIC component [Bifidobacterium saguini DSM 23967]QTB91587.1 PTS glucose transporter subunit IIA [Bifidobacterium saguini]